MKKQGLYKVNYDSSKFLWVNPSLPKDLQKITREMEKNPKEQFGAPRSPECAVPPSNYEQGEHISQDVS